MRIKNNYLYKVLVNKEDNEYEIVHVIRLKKYPTKNIFRVVAETVQFLYELSEIDKNTLKDWGMDISEDELKNWEEFGDPKDFPEYFV